MVTKSIRWSTTFTQETRTSTAMAAYTFTKPVWCQTTGVGVVFFHKRTNIISYLTSQVDGHMSIDAAVIYIMMCALRKTFLEHGYPLSENIPRSHQGKSYRYKSSGSGPRISLIQSNVSALDCPPYRHDLSPIEDLRNEFAVNVPTIVQILRLKTIYLLKWSIVRCVRSTIILRVWRTHYLLNHDCGKWQEKG